MWRDSLPTYVRCALHALLSLPELPAPDRKRFRLLIETDRVELLAGDPQPVGVPRDDGSTQRIFRCPTCQVAVFSQYSRPEVRFVRGGTLDEPSGVTPDVHIFTTSKLSWITLPESVPAFEVYYDPKALWPAASLERLEAIMSPANSDT